ncbi:rna-directed dna polymerase from mobile element jockey-like [Pitangus sulphuratus]|nr:rna-directed dna polymerase from mobile element jockey-like [Pitangus sulphuratus]KAJ7419225.1 rna-directed dna polymerase from mobile element jockey-like [Pitangus sulphuratus]
MDGGIECTLSKFAGDTKLCVQNTLEGRDAIQRDLDRLERWVCVNLMKFNKAKCEVSPLSWGNATHRYKPGGKWTENSPEEKDLRVLLDETQQYLLAAQKASHETLPGVLLPALGSPE